jgi:hypothetical protein
MNQPKPSIIFRPLPSRATPVPHQEFVPVAPLLERDLHARQTVGLIRFVLVMAIAALVFFIVVFGVLGALAHAIGSAFGLHKNYPDIVGTR